MPINFLAATKYYSRELIKSINYFSDLFSRSVSSLTQQQKQHKQQNSTPSKEPNLMPVPSPQQIQYLNAFEGQELTIQKQPNTSLKESNMNSPL